MHRQSSLFGAARTADKSANDVQLELMYTCVFIFGQVLTVQAGALTDHRISNITYERACRPLTMSWHTGLQYISGAAHLAEDIPDSFAQQFSSL